MGDAPATSNSASEYPTPDAVTGQSLGSSSADAHLLYSTGNNSTDSQLSSTPQFQHQYPGGGGHNAYASAYEMPQSQGPQGPGRGGAFNMNAMANALPQPGYRPAQYMPGAQRYNPAGSTPNMVAQMHSAPPYPGQGAMGTVPNQQYYMPQHAHVGPYYAGPMSPTQQQQGNMSPRTNMGYYPAQVIMNNQQAAAPGSYYYTQTSQYAPQSQMVPNQFVSPAPPPAENRSMSAPGGIPQTGPAFMYDQGQQQQSVQQSSQSNVVRGPPRKPKQSGHAIWIGNLPPATDLMSLVHHVCGEAEGLESLFLISKSNCAFANFKDEQSCVAAQQKLHDSKFQTVRLVSRLRKSTVEGASGVTAPTGPAASAPQQAAHHESASDTFAEDDTEKSTKTSPPPPAADGQTAARPEASLRKDKFFILKSLTVEDLDLSVRTGIWATQSHNERALNSAFKAADNVYLVFSANKSGEYFGYARMTSPMDEDPAAAIEFAPQAQFANDVDLPKAIPTEATEFAPRGRIIDDSSRGTIFWEAERQESPDAAAAVPPDVEETASTGEADDSSSVRSGQEGGESKAWGKPFKLEWMSTTRLPFYRTRGLRNPWNSNREVKIARDGTELEPSVGRRLISLFNRVQSPAPGSLAGPGMRHPHMQMMPGYHAGRPPYQQ